MIPRRAGWLALLAGLGLGAGCAAGVADSAPPPVRVVSETPGGAYEASLAVLPAGLLAGWYDTRDGQAEIYLRLLDETGAPAGPEQRVTVTDADSYEVDLAVAGERVGVAWYEKAADGTYASWLALREPGGAEIWRTEIAPGGRNPLVEWDGEAFFCAWLEDGAGAASTVWAGWWGLDGIARVAPRPLAPAGRTTWNLNAAAVAPGDVWLVFDAQAGTAREELFAARVTRAGATLARLTPDDGVPSKYPDVAVAADGRVALAWHDERDGNQEVYLALGDPSPAAAAAARRVTETPGNSFGAYLAWNRNRLGLAWSDEIDGQAEVHFRAFAADLAPLGDARRVTDTPASSLVPSIRAWRDGFAFAWNEYEPAPEGAHADTARSQVALAFSR